MSLQTFQKKSLILTVALPSPEESKELSPDNNLDHTKMTPEENINMKLPSFKRKAPSEEMNSDVKKAKARTATPFKDDLVSQEIIKSAMEQSRGKSKGKGKGKGKGKAK